MPIRSYEDLEAYQRARVLIIAVHQLARVLIIAVHQLVAGFPDYEKYGLCDQMRRASKSVTANIVEGYSHKDTPAKAKQFWRISMGSANEMVEHLRTAVDLGYLTPDAGKPHIEEYTVVAKQLNRLIRAWQTF